MNIYKKFGIQLATCVILIWFVCQPLADVGRCTTYMEMPEEEHELTHSELNAFLEVWGYMMQSSFKEKFKGTSLKTDGQYPKGLQKWLRIQHWDINRFFYVEQRIKDLVEYVEVKKQLDDNAKIAKASRINLNDMNTTLRKRLDANSYSNNELNLIETNLYQITEILAGNAVLGN